MHETSKEVDFAIALEHGRTGWHDAMRLVEAWNRIAELEAALKKIADGCAEPKTRLFAREALSR